MNKLLFTVSKCSSKSSISDKFMNDNGSVIHFTNNHQAGVFHLLFDITINKRSQSLVEVSRLQSGKKLLSFSAKSAYTQSSR